MFNSKLYAQKRAKFGPRLYAEGYLNLSSDKSAERRIKLHPELYAPDFQKKIFTLAKTLTTTIVFFINLLLFGRGGGLALRLLDDGSSSTGWNHHSKHSWASLKQNLTALTLNDLYSLTIRCALNVNGLLHK
jgi:hypothetical protein